MTLTEAIKCGKPFRRKGDAGAYFWTLESASNCANLERDKPAFSVADILADDWEVQVAKVTVTAGQVKDAFNKHKGNLQASKFTCCGVHETMSVSNDQVLLRRMMQDLGLDYDSV